MDALYEANSLFVQENYEEASKLYTTSLITLTGPHQFNAYFGRARCSMLSGFHSSAIHDFCECISMNDSHQLSHYYFAICFMKTAKSDEKKLKQAHKSLLIANKGKLKQIRFKKALQKCIRFLKKLNPKTQMISNEEKEADMKEMIEEKTNTIIKTNTNVNNKPVPKSKSPSIREQWYQTSEAVTLTLYVKNLSFEDVDISFSEHSIKCEINLPSTDANYIRTVNLLKAIIPVKCSWTMNRYKVNIKICKAVTNEDWETLESVIDDGQERNDAQAKNRSWKELEMYADEELGKEKPEGDDALHTLFQQIYKDADDDQRRAMVKSFQTSNGTVLSTNWKDVKTKDYEGKDQVLPTGQDLKKWEQ